MGKVENLVKKSLNSCIFSERYGKDKVIYGEEGG